MERADIVAREAEVHLRFLRSGEIVNVFRVHCLPALLRELAIGFMICEDFRSSANDVHVRKASADDSAEIYEVSVELSQADRRGRDVAGNGARRNGARQNGARRNGARQNGARQNDARRNDARHDHRHEEITALVRNLEDRGIIYRKTGCTHVVGVFSCDGRYHVVEDVSRHCAIDKAVGMCVERGISTEESILVTSCRQTFSTMRRAANAGFPVVVSISAPTSEAIRIAEIHNITLIGFARGRRFNVYANAWRLLGDGAGAI